MKKCEIELNVPILPNELYHIIISNCDIMTRYLFKKYLLKNGWPNSDTMNNILKYNIKDIIKLSENNQYNFLEFLDNNIEMYEMVNNINFEYEKSILFNNGMWNLIYSLGIELRYFDCDYNIYIDNLIESKKITKEMEYLLTECDEMDPISMARTLMYWYLLIDENLKNILISHQVKYIDLEIIKYCYKNNCFHKVRNLFYENVYPENKYIGEILLLSAISDNDEYYLQNYELYVDIGMTREERFNNVELLGIISNKQKYMETKYYSSKPIINYNKHYLEHGDKKFVRTYEFIEDNACEYSNIHILLLKNIMKDDKKTKKLIKNLYCFENIISDILFLSNDIYNIDIFNVIDVNVPTMHNYMYYLEKYIFLENHIDNKAKILWKYIFDYYKKNMFCKIEFEIHIEKLLMFSKNKKVKNDIISYIKKYIDFKVVEQNFYKDEIVYSVIINDVIQIM